MAAPPVRDILAQETFPTRPITLVVAWAPGGSSDLVGRLVAEGMSKQLGQPVVVENRPGASGSIGQASVARARADGYTILMSGRGTFAMLPHLLPNHGYDEMRDFAAIDLLCETPIYLCASARLGARNLAELIALAKAKPAQLNYASAGAGSSAHIATELFLAQADIKVQNVTYRGGAPAVQALITGEAQMAMVDAVTALPLIRAGQVTGIAVGSSERFPQTPEIPTIGETLPGYEVSSQFALLAPSGTPQAVIQRLWTAMDATMRDPAVLDRMQAVAFIPRVGTPDAFLTYLAAETARWGKIIRARRITME
jgi:tripartite-type tricarboxylate transporter receptor subunit TctC